MRHRSHQFHFLRCKRAPAICHVENWIHGKPTTRIGNVRQRRISTVRRAEDGRISGWRQQVRQRDMDAESKCFTCPLRLPSAPGCQSGCARSLVACLGCAGLFFGNSLANARRGPAGAECSPTPSLPLSLLVLSALHPANGALALAPVLPLSAPMRTMPRLRLLETPWTRIPCTHRFTVIIGTPNVFTTSLGFATGVSHSGP
jgi:hypothetical protein